MKAQLLFPGRDPDRDDDPMERRADVVRDLGLETLFSAMAADDDFVREVVERVVLAAVPTVDDVRHRQGILADCLAHPKQVRELYDVAVHASQTKKRARYFLLGDYPNAVLYRAIALLEELAADLDHLDRFRASYAGLFRSDGLRDLMAILEGNLDADYLAVVRDHLQRLAFQNGVFMTARLNDLCQGTDYVLRKPERARWSWRDLLSFFQRSDVYTYRIPDRDENGARRLSYLRDQGINQVADAAAQAADHVLDFFLCLRFELAFYVGALNLHARLGPVGAPICLPAVHPAEEVVLEGSDLRDVGLLLRSRDPVVGNDLDATGRTLVVVTGANEGGKSTLLRSLGLAQLMSEAGLFVSAASFGTSLSTGLFTHYRREEDAEMTSGKLDEELARMSRLVDQITPGALVLFNESFACTNEREGSEVARTIVRALQDSGVRVAFVTHMHDLAGGLAADGRASDTFLRAERLPDGRRTHRVVPGAPEPTSYGRDLYDEVFASAL